MSVAQAQQSATITGRVISDQGAPLAGANVFINEMNISVGTNSSGQYTITIPQARLGGQTVILRARAIGYSPNSQQIRINPGTQTVNFELRRELTQLSEVVVTGVTTATEQRKLAFTVTRVDTSMMPVAGSNPVTQLQGKVPGAIIMNPSGRPGAAPQVILRGPTSLNATGRTQQPLYLLDGVPLQGALPDINPDDIANVEVVKGAAAASVYGARAGAGVINITTKTGRHAQQGMRFGLRTELGKSDIEREFPLSIGNTLVLAPDGRRFCSREVLAGGVLATTPAGQNQGVFAPCARYLEWDAEVQRVNNSGADFALNPVPIMGDFGISNTPSYEQLTGTYQASFPPLHRNPIRQALTSQIFANSNFDLRGRAANTGLFASLGSLVQQGSLRFLPGFVRTAARGNVDHSFEKISASLTTFYSASRDHGAHLDEAGGTAGTWFNLSRAPWMANLLARDDQGRIVVRHNPLFQGFQNYNPLYAALYHPQVDRNTRYVGSLQLRAQPVLGLTVDGTLGYDQSSAGMFRMRDRGWRTTTESPLVSAGEIAEGAWQNAQWNATLNVSASWNVFQLLGVTVTNRYTFSDLNLRTLRVSGSGLSLPGLATADAATTNLLIGSRKQSIRDMAFFHGIDLDYKERYILGGLVRRDGSSLFGAGERWQTFGRVSAAWLVSSEPWWFATQGVTLLKVRAARGSTGQRPRFDAQYEAFTLGPGGTLNPGVLGNRNLRPEINTETEVGTDFEIMSRVGGSVVYSKAVIADQILPVGTSAASGYSTRWLNAGELTNQVWEVSVSIPIMRRGSLNWSSRSIWDQMRSRISRLYIPEFLGTIMPGPTNTFDIFKFRQGERVGTVYGLDMVRRCDQLPAPFDAQCSMNPEDMSAAFRPNDHGFIVWVGEGNRLTEGITRNLWRARLELGTPGCANTNPQTCPGPWGSRTNWGMPILLRDSLNGPAFAPLGNGLPKFRWSHAQNFEWRRLSLYALLDASIGQRMWNAAYHWSMGDLTSTGADQIGKSVDVAKPIGYYWRRGASISPGSSSGVGGIYDALAVHGWSFENASYVKLREVSATYRFGRLAGIGDWRAGFVGRNLRTWTSWRGFDPESGNTTGPYNSSILTPVAGYRFPNLRTITAQVTSTF